jgi:predicted RNase H-like HicB family nuclease
MNKYLIEIFWSDEDAGYIATVPDLPGCSAYGETLEEAAREIKDAQEAWLEACRASGDIAPLPTMQARKAA